nr:MAG TPA: hypothetical protein [Caudoviricetes sp.]
MKTITNRKKTIKTSDGKTIEIRMTVFNAYIRSAFGDNDHRIWTASDGSEWVKGNGSGYYRQIHRVNGVYKYTYEDADVID